MTRLTVTHDVTDEPIAESMITSDGEIGEGGGGWSWLLRDLEWLLETGATMDGAV